MKQNIGKTDRVVRLAVALLLVVLLVAGVVDGAVGIILGIIAIALAVTALVGTCPLYLLLNLSTRPKHTT